MNKASFYVVIPARYASSRFPGKVLALLDERPVLAHVWRQAQRSGAADVVIATDDERIAAAARGFGADVALTSASHRSGTERAAEVAALRGWPDDTVVVNCQGDAPLIPPACIDQVAALLLARPGAALATLCTPIRSAEEYMSPHVVKVVCDRGWPGAVLQPGVDPRNQPWSGGRRGRLSGKFAPRGPVRLPGERLAPHGKRTALRP